MKGQRRVVAWPVLGAHQLHLCSARGPAFLSRCSRPASVLPDEKQGPQVGKMPVGPAPPPAWVQFQVKKPWLHPDEGSRPATIISSAPWLVQRPDIPGVSLFAVFLKNRQTSHLPRPAAPSSSCPEPLAQFPHCRPPAGPRQAMLRSTVATGYCSFGEIFCFSALEPFSIHACTLARTAEQAARGRPAKGPRPHSGAEHIASAGDLSRVPTPSEVRLSPSMWAFLQDMEAREHSRSTEASDLTPSCLSA